MNYLIAALLFALSIQIQAQNTVSKTIKIDPALSFQRYEHFKRLVLKSPDSQAEYIEGFQFEWGYNYELSVKETQLPEDLSDGTRFNYSLDSVISKIKVPDSTEFRLTLDPLLYYYRVEEEGIVNETFEQLNDSTYLYFEEVEVVVPENLKSKFQAIVNSQSYSVGTFTFVEANKIRLTKL